MSPTCPIAWFEIVTQDLERAIQFYEKAFDTQLKRLQDTHKKVAIFPYTDGFPSGALVHSEYYADHKAGAGTIVIYLTTDSVTNQLAKIKAIGGEEVFPVTSIGEHGYIAGFKDSEGNHIGLWSENP